MIDLLNAEKRVFKKGYEYDKTFNKLMKQMISAINSVRINLR